MNKVELKKVWQKDQNLKSCYPILFTPSQKELLKKHCETKNIQLSKLIRIAIYEYLRRKCEPKKRIAKNY